LLNRGIAQLIKNIFKYYGYTHIIDLLELKHPLELQGILIHQNNPETIYVKSQKHFIKLK
jgi:hypothetical protein